MNLGLFKRAIHRHKHMQDTPAYRIFLEEISRHPDVWKTTQANITEWWEKRQNADLVLEAGDDARLRITSSLPGCVIEVDGEKLIPPLELDISTDMSPGPIILGLGCPSDHKDLFRELLGHLGYNHIKIKSGDDGWAARDIDRFLTILNVLREVSEVHQKYDISALAELRGMISDIHHRNHIPDIRIWPLPHSDGRPYQVAVSTRYDVDKAIINLPKINDLESRFNLVSTAYVRPLGMFYGKKEITDFGKRAAGAEIALHGEFISTAEDRFGDEFKAAMGEKQILEEMIGREVKGVCMHGGELRSNTSSNTYHAVEKAGFKYNTFFRNSYYHPLHILKDGQVGKILSIGQHYADITVKPGPGFVDELAGSFIGKFNEARDHGGIFVPVLHPLYFDLFHYLTNLRNAFRIMNFIPRYLISLSRMKKSQSYLNQSQ